MTFPPTRYAQLPRGLALLLLAAAATVLGAGLWLELRPAEEGAKGKPPKYDDWTFYRLQIEGMRDGADYYTMEKRLFADIEYTPFSVFNVRPPLLAYLLSSLPDPFWGQVLLVLLGLGTMVLIYPALRWDVDAPLAAAGAALLLGAVLWCFVTPALYAHELWAGLLIALSVAAYGVGWWPVGVVAGLLALFFRELSLPYCFISLGFAVAQRRRQEVICWLMGFVQYGIFLFFHFRAVQPLIAPDSGRSALDWLQLGGLPFVLTTTRMNYFLLVLLPAWATAVYLPLAFLGLAGWRGDLGARAALTVAVYLGAFCLVGQSVNRYWGLMYTPLLALGLLWLPASLRDLRHALLGRPDPADRPA